MSSARASWRFLEAAMEELQLSLQSLESGSIVMLCVPG